MDWEFAAGTVAVVVVIALGTGALVALLTVNTLLGQSGDAIPALVTLAVAILGLLVAVVLAGPSRRWLSNPYW